MDTAMELGSGTPSGEVHENIISNSSEGNTTTQHNEEKEQNVEITSTSDLLEQNFENPTPSADETPETTAMSVVDSLAENDNVVEAEDKMDTESPAASNDTESTTGEDTSMQPVDATTPKTEKKPRARASSESSQTPTANKVAKLTPRATRSSQNPDFAAKQRKFLNRVHDPIRNNNSDSENSQGSPIVTKGTKENKSRSSERKSNVSSDLKKKSDKESTPKRLADSDEEGSSKKRKTKEPTKVVGGVDSYCWRCHRDGVVIHCECAPCPRVYHVKCVQLDKPPDSPWMCPECSLVTQAEDTDTRSRAMRMLSLDQLCNLLRFALNRMKNHEGAEDFSKPVDPVQFPQYRDYIVKPMDLSQLERNLKGRLYGSTEAFLADAKWIVHNSIIFNSVQSKFTNTARALLKLCRQEMQHIENCPDCYQNSHTRSSDSWFTEACRRPHILVWAKLKGFPFWPAKVMSVNAENNQVDVRFFGAHDRAWIPLNQCFLYSKLSPTPTSNNKNKRSLEECLQEVEYHIKRLRDKFGRFEYAPYKTQYDPKNEDAQLLLMLPQYETKIMGKRSRLSLHHDGARKSLGRRTISPKHSSPEKPVTEETPAEPPALNGASEGDSPSDQGDQPMVFIPGKSKGAANSPVRTPPRTPLRAGEPETDRTKLNATPVLKKKTPLTAAAKKCFATEERSCFKCRTKTTVEWSIDSAGRSLCTACTLLRPKYERLQDKVCAKCDSRTSTTNEESLCSVCSNLDKKLEIHVKCCGRCGTTITMMWLKDAAGGTLCSSCGYAERFKKDMRSGDPNSTVRGTVTVPRRRAILGEGDQPDEGTTEPLSEHLPDATGKKKPESEMPEAGKETPAGDGGPVESPSKFVVQKALDSPEPAKKVSIVDRLKEKLCFTVFEALKDQMTPEEVQAIEQDKDVDSSPEKTNEVITPAQDTSAAVVVLHDLRNDKGMMDKLRESDANKTTEKNKEAETHPPSDVGSEVETDVSSCGDSDVTDENKRRKKKNINNVVQNLKERKSSMDERIESGKKVNTKNSNPLTLDGSVEESSILIIDEGESSDSKKSNGGKSDKSRRKGIPAKVHSRSSTSTESFDAENGLHKSRSIEVLDEASGHFRRSSGENDRPVTITVVTDDNKPQKKANKEIRSVNISSGLTLSVIKDSAGMETECVVDDDDDPVIVDSIRKIQPRPTARKTLPNPPPLPRQTSVDKRPASVPATGSQPPPLTSLRQTKQVGPARTPPSPRSLPPPVKPSPRAELGPAHAKIEEIIQKMVTFVRSTFDEMLRAEAEVSGENVEAVRQACQLDMERLRWQHKQEMAELKHNTDLVVTEMRASMEAEKQRVLLDLMHKMEMEKDQAVLETKRKQWCAYCQKEAQLYCCWNTSYCSYNCQQDHWAPHMNDCRNSQTKEDLAPPQRSAAVPAYSQMHALESVDGPKTGKVKKRKRCGYCVGCTAEPCGSCHPCTDSRVHSVCVRRRCSNLGPKSQQTPRQQRQQRQQRQLMPPPPVPPPLPIIPPYLPLGFPMLPPPLPPLLPPPLLPPPQPQSFHHRNRGPPLFYPPEGFCPQCP